MFSASLLTYQLVLIVCVQWILPEGVEDMRSVEACEGCGRVEGVRCEEEGRRVSEDIHTSAQVSPFITAHHSHTTILG